MEQLKKLLAEAGYNETDIEKITAKVVESKYVPDFYIPKARLDEVIAQRESLKEQVDAYDKQINELKKNAGENEELKKQLEQAKEEAKKIAKDGEAKIKEFYKSNAIKSAFADKVHSADVVYGMLDTSKIIYDEDKKVVVAGLDEQLNALQEKSGWLFKTNTPTPAGGGYVPPQGNPTPPPKPEDKSEAVLRAERLAHKSNQ